MTALLPPSRCTQALIACLALCSLPAWADDPVSRSVDGSARSSAQASLNAVQAVGASARATLAVSAVPLAIGGSVLGAAGAASTATSVELQGDAPSGRPLPITREVITVTPPDVALHSAAPSPAAATR